MLSSARVHALIACAGTGSRLAFAQPKQYHVIAGQPLVLHTVQAFLACPQIDTGIVVTATHDPFWDGAMREAIAPFQVHAVGGATRALSVMGGLRSLLAQGAAEDDWVLVHDAARCLITSADISALITACLPDSVGGLLASPLVDTLKCAEADAQGQLRSVSTLMRQDKWQAQTPQMFRIGPLCQALSSAGEHVTDEASAMEALGYSAQLVANPNANPKVTYAHDLIAVEQVLRARATPSPTQLTVGALGLPPLPKLRIGEGWDSHVLVTGRPLILGGLAIPFDRGLQGHSDADVLLHAITDAVLGAAALGDIGRHFADTDVQHLGADSRNFLRHALQLARAQGWHVLNVDATIIAQAPKLAPYMPALVESVAGVLSLPQTQVNIKAKTAEKLGPVGEGKSMEARAVVLLAGS